MSRRKWDQIFIKIYGNFHQPSRHPADSTAKDYARSQYMSNEKKLLSQNHQPGNGAGRIVVIQG
jgi:hypothetical protein